MKTLKAHQNKINSEVTTFLIDPIKTRGQIYSPTGSGKTECFIHTINELSNILGDSQWYDIAVLHPRLALSQEQLGRFHQAFGDRFHYTSFHSGAHVLNNSKIMGKSTLDPKELFRIMENCPNTHITFSSYDSFSKISDYEFDLVICDEAHNLTQDQYYNALSTMKAKKILFYTATPIVKSLVDTDDENSKGMDNITLFGDIISRVEPKELIQKGYIVPPLMHLMKVSTNKRGADVDTVEIIAQTFKEQYDEMKKHGMPYVQMLVASRGSRDIDVVNVEENLFKLQQLIGIDQFVDVYTVKCSEHLKNSKPYNGSRYDMLQHIKQSKKHAIIIHYDTLAEGIDISSLTGACILRNLSKPKLLQTVGRCGRPLLDDMTSEYEVIDMLTRMKPYCVITLPIVDGTPISGNNVKEWCEAFIIGGYGDLSDFLKDSDRKTMSKSENNWDMGSDEEDPIMSNIIDFEVERDGRRIVELGFVI